MIKFAFQFIINNLSQGIASRACYIIPFIDMQVVFDIATSMLSTEFIRKYYYYKNIECS